MDGECGTHEKQRNACSGFAGILEGKGLRDDQGIDLNMILKMHYQEFDDAPQE